MSPSTQITRQHAPFQHPDRIQSSVPTPRKQPADSRHGPAYPAPVERLLTELTRLPGIGRRSAERIAFHLLRGDNEAANRLAKAVTDVKSAIGHCAVCSNLTESSPCPVCASEKRDRSTVLVVEQPRDLRHYHYLRWLQV